MCVRGHGCECNLCVYMSLAEVETTPLVVCDRLSHPGLTAGQAGQPVCSRTLPPGRLGALPDFHGSEEWIQVTYQA